MSSVDVYDKENKQTAEDVKEENQDNQFNTANLIQLITLTMIMIVGSILTGDGGANAIPKSLWISVWLTIIIHWVICSSIKWGKPAGPDSRIEGHRANELYRNWMDQLLHSIGNEPWKNYNTVAVLCKRKDQICDVGHIEYNCDNVQKTMDTWVNSLLETGVILSEEITKTKPQFRNHRIYQESLAGILAFGFIIVGSWFITLTSYRDRANRMNRRAGVPL